MCSKRVFFFPACVCICICMRLHAGASTGPHVELGDASAASSSQAAIAAREACSGAWVHELESGLMSRVCAPGLSSGIFGAWAQASTADSDQAAAAAGKFVTDGLQYL